MLKVLFFGNPLWDSMYNVDEAFLISNQLAANYAMLGDNSAMIKDLQNRNIDHADLAGGSAQSSARAAAWTLRSLGLDSREEDQCFISYSGCVGDDNVAGSMRQACEAAGVEACYQVDPSHITGTCLVCINDKNRSLVAHLGAAVKYDDSKFDDSSLANYDIFYMEGFFAFASESTFRRVADFAKQNKDKKLIVNVSSPIIATMYKQLFVDIFDSIDYLFGNEEEIAELGKQLDLSDNSLPQLIAIELSKLYGRTADRPLTVIVTQGSQPTIIAKSGDSESTLHPIELIDSDAIVDTNGAGDSYVGGFIAGLMRGLPDSYCARFGAIAAKHVIQRAGATYEPPSGEEKVTLKLIHTEADLQHEITDLKNQLLFFGLPYHRRPQPGSRRGEHQTGEV